MVAQCETCRNDEINTCTVPGWRTTLALEGNCPTYRASKKRRPATMPVAPQHASVMAVEPMPKRIIIKRTYGIFEDQETWLKAEAFRRHKTIHKTVPEAAIVREALDAYMKEGE